MVQKVAAPLEYALLAQSSSLVYDFARRGLQELSTQKLLEHKLVTKNFKQGISFDTPADMRHGFRKLLRLAKNQLIKDISWLETEIPGTFISEGHSSSVTPTLLLSRDRAIRRYCNRINLLATSKGIPIMVDTADTVTASPTPGEVINATKVSILLPGTSHVRHLYKLFLFLPETLKILKTISRKAQFRNETHRAINRYSSPSSHTVRQA